MCGYTYISKGWREICGIIYSLGMNEAAGARHPSRRHAAAASATSVAASVPFSGFASSAAVAGDGVD